MKQIYALKTNIIATINRFFLLGVVLCICNIKAFCQPANDNCNNATVINIPNSGFGTGVYTSSNSNIANATIQTGETFSSTNFIAGQNQKSVWYKFTLGTTRQLRVALKQNGTAIAAGDVGFAMYETNTCLPNNGQLSGLISPLESFGNSFNPCVKSGEYLIQVCAKSVANGSIYIELEVDHVNNLPQYNLQSSAYEFGVINVPSKVVVYNVSCQSREPEEVCTGGLLNMADYTKTTWHTFTTPSGYFDYVNVMFASNAGTFGGNYVFGYNLYQGNAKTTPLNALTLVDGCDTIHSNGNNAGVKKYLCGQLSPNTTYSIQLFYHKNFNQANFKLSVSSSGTAPTGAPRPIYNQMNANNILGALPNGTTQRQENMACNSIFRNNGCGNLLPNAGVTYSGQYFDMSTFYSLTLSQNAQINIAANVQNPSCGNVLVRIFNDSISNNCSSIQMSSLVDQFFGSKSLYCLPAGKYTIQILTRSELSIPLTHHYVTGSTGPTCYNGYLGRLITLNLNTTYFPQTSNYNLSAPGKFDTINNNVPLVHNNVYQTQLDTVSCNNTVVPANANCAANYTKVIYRQFQVADSGSVTFNNLNASTLFGVSLRYGLFKGNANSLAVAQNVWSYPQTITGLTPYSFCFAPQPDIDICITSGTYTFATYGRDYHGGFTDQPSVVYKNYVTQHRTPATAYNMGSIIDTIANPLGGSIISTNDTFSCLNNAVTIDTIAPCDDNTKAIYREFYLSSPAKVTITKGGNSAGELALFEGRISSVGINGLVGLWSCFTTKVTDTCEMLPIGWYTVVSYGKGSSYSTPFIANDISGGDVGKSSNITIKVEFDCLPPRFNRPYKAAVDSLTNNPFLIQWNAAADTGAYPVTGMHYVLRKENFNCEADTPFVAPTLDGCGDTLVNRVAYYVFELTQESYLNFNTKGHWAKIYKRDIRVDSMLFSTLTPLQACMKNSNRIEICKAQPGIYTLVLFATDIDICSSLTPEIYVDKVGTSRFDHARNAYDFAVVTPNNAFHNARVGDTNPFHSGRAASNDFFYCTTGARAADPNNAVCNATYNPNSYNVPDTNNVLYPAQTTATTITRRNLWYTFVVDRPSYVSVKVVGKTNGKNSQARFAVYSSDVNPSLPFSQVVSNGLVDSTLAQGLEYVIANGTNATNCSGDSVITFLLSPCNGVYPKRYYVLVDNVGASGNYNAMRPNHQVEVAIKVDTVVNNTLAKYDYFANAYNMGSLTQGSHLGDEDNYSCASTSANESAYLPACANKTLWYKFNIGTYTSGELRVRMWLDSMVFNTTTNDVKLFKEINIGDSTVNDLQPIALTAFSGWQRTCIKEGTYYLALTGCNRTFQDVYPEIVIEESNGDFCSNAVNLSVVGAGNYTASLNVDCHTIGTDYGELGDSLTCPPNSLTQNYKSSWFRVNVGGTDSLDVTAFITENTNVNANQIMYRMMSGNCNAMQEQSCVLDANTQNTYFCLLPGRSYYIQVFTPKVANNNTNTTGSITLNVGAVSYQDSCAPPTICFSNAAFVSSFNCAISDSVNFNNHSTFGSSVNYLWNFGYNNDTSNLFSPKYRYPALPYAANYTVTLRVINTDCNDTSYISHIVSIPPRPEVDLGADTSICNANDSIILDATFAAGATYLWHNNSTNPTFVANQSGLNTYSVTVTYAGCTASDTISVYIADLIKNPIDTIIKCTPGDLVWLNGYQSISNVNYLWNTNSNDSAIQISASGLYWVELTDGVCTIRDSFVVNNAFDSLISLGNDTSLCENQAPLLLDATYSGASYLWHNNSTNATFDAYTTGLFWVAVTKDGCTISDSILVTVDDVILNNIADTICFGDYYVLPWNDTAFGTGTYSDTFATAFCDSIVNVHLVIRDSVHSVSVYDTVCNNQLPYVWNGQNVTTTTAQYTTTNIYGCDSTTNLFLTINLTDSIVLYDTICADELPYNFLGTPINGSGTYYDTLLTSLGCDSFIRLHLQVNPIYNDTINTTICDGDSFVFNSIAHYISGTYTHNLNTVMDCDSVIVLILNVTPYIVNNINDTVCFGDYYILPWSDTVYASGTYSDTFAATTCDSIVNVLLHIRDSVPPVSVYASVCINNLPFVWNGQNVTTATAQYTTVNIYGCDSTTNLFLTINPIDSIEVFDTVCSNQLPYNFFGSNLNTTGTYYHTGQTILGCDSNITLHLQVYPYFTDTVTAIICQGDSFVLNNIGYYNTGLYTQTYTSINGCDSYAVLNLTVTPTPLPPTVNSPVVYCQGDAPSTLTAFGLNLLWYTTSVGGSGASASPVPSTAVIGQTWYYVSQTVNNCESLRDSILVKVNERPIASFELIPDSSSICANETVVVNFTGLLPTGANMIWNWSGGAVTGIDPGPYTVYWNGSGNKIISLTIDNDGCVSNTYSDNIEVLPVADIPKIIVPDFVCINDSILVVGEINIPNSIYNWTLDNTNLPNQKEHQFVWTQPGEHTFTLQAETNGCLSPVVTKNVNVVPLPEIAFAINNTQNRLCLDAPINIYNNKHAEGYSYMWGPESYFQFDENRTHNSVYAMLNKKGWVNVTVEDLYGCSNTDSIYIDAIPCCEYFIPNAFSPNNDGLNDEFLPYTYSLYQLYDFQVFNRWGERVFSTTNQKEGWDGTHKGKQADIGVYHYYFRFICGESGSLEIKKGEIHLLR